MKKKLIFSTALFGLGILGAANADEAKADTYTVEGNPEITVSHDSKEYVVSGEETDQLVLGAKQYAEENGTNGTVTWGPNVDSVDYGSGQTASGKNYEYASVGLSGGSMTVETGSQAVQTPSSDKNNSNQTTNEGSTNIESKPVTPNQPVKPSTPSTPTKPTTPSTPDVNNGNSNETPAENNGQTPNEKGYVNPLGDANYTYVQGMESGHNGVDLAVPTGTPVYAATSGNVVWAGQMSHENGDEPAGYGSMGNVVIVKNDDGLYTWYMHLSELAVKPKTEYNGKFSSFTPGQRVEAGDLIGLSGASGRDANGNFDPNFYDPHLHVSLTKPSNPDMPWGTWVDPEKYIKF